MKDTACKDLVQRQADAWQRGDIEAIVADFDEAGALITPGGTWVGPAAIRQAALDFWATVQSLQVEIKRLLVDGDQGAVEWRWTEVRLADGQAHSADDAIIFTLKQGKIVYWREYFDTVNF
jgi:uncharacterized protein (TIGR02246 family)